MKPTGTAAYRSQVYLLLITIALGAVLGRILSANRSYEPFLAREPANPDDIRSAWPKARPRPMPTFSSNDRSRWATIRALVDQQTYVIGEREIIDPKTGAYRDSGIIFEDGWQSVDKVMDPQTRKFYSSKPPLFSTLLAGEYWLLRRLAGWSLESDAFPVVRAVLVTVNWLPLLLYWIVLARLLERFGGTDWGRLYVMAAACFGTFVTTFAITLNNHTVAACLGLFALYFALGGPTEETTPRYPDFLRAGLCAGLAFALELPALSFLVGLFALLLGKAPRLTLLGFLPPVVVVVSAMLLTNYLALGRLKPAYAEVGAKSEWYMYEGSHWRDDPGKDRRGIDFASKREGRAAYMFHFLFGHHGIFSLSPIYLISMAGLIIALAEFRKASGRVKSPLSPVLGGEGSGVRGGCDLPGNRPLTLCPSPPEYRGRGENITRGLPKQPEQTAALAADPPRAPTTSPPRDDGNAARAQQFTAAPPHESTEAPPLAPLPLRDWGPAPWSTDSGYRLLVLLTVYLTVVVVGFYLVYTNNYGGWTSGPRWVFWLTPFWLLTMLPAVDRLAAWNGGRILALFFLGISVLSASYPAWNPWRHPWIFQVMEAYGWIAY